MADEDQSHVTFRQSVAIEALKMGFTEEKTKLSGDAAKTAAEFLRMFVAEALIRSRDVALGSDDTVIETQHLEKILAQLLLDF